jgi:Signal transduction histidine kinase
LIKELQKRFLKITLISVTVVLFMVLLSINAANYYKVRVFSDQLLTALAKNGGEFKIPEGGDPPEFDVFNRGMTKETPFETRYFWVQFDTNGEVLDEDTGKIASVDAATAVEYAEDVMSKTRTKGSYKGRYRYLVSENEDNTTAVIFVDCSRTLSTAREFLLQSAIIFFVGVAAIVGISIILTRIAVEPIAESYEKQKHFITDAGHELKTPLTIISANNEILKMENGESEWTRSIDKQVKRMATLTKSLTTLAKMDENNADAEMLEFSFSDAMADVTESFDAPAKTSGKTLNSEIESGINYVGDERLLRQLASILLDNAVKYSKSLITISLHRAKSKTVLEITNDVAGVEIGDTSKYFDRFYRGDASRFSAIEGSGIGLSIAKEIVELHKGKISAESANGRVTVRAIL